MAAKAVSFNIPEIKLENFKLYLIGTAPLIVHAFPEKARKQMLDKQMKVAKGGRDARDPLAEVEDAKYILPDGRHGFPAVAFKACAVTACTSLSDVTKTAARQAFRVKGLGMDAKGVIDGSFVRTALVPLIAHEPTVREDVVRLSGIGRTPEMRYRPEYSIWGVELDIVLNPQVISAGQLGSMFQAAGHGVGVGDYRPERDGDCGTFDVVSEADFAKWRKDAKLSNATLKEAA
jgi:hypothetical protein